MMVLNSSFEGKLVEYYDSFFLKNDVQKEVRYVCDIIRKYVNTSDLLDAGCGTGLHAREFSKYFDKVSAIDLSPDMIAYAKDNHAAANIEYDVLDVRKLSKRNRYDAIIALSHVIGYQLENIDVEDMLVAINGALKKGGGSCIQFL